MENYLPALGMLFFAVVACIVAVSAGGLLIAVWRSRGKTWPASIRAAAIGIAICEGFLCLMCVGGAALLAAGFAHITSVPPDDLIGTYEAEYPDGSRPIVKEVLILRRDSTYDQTITRTGGPALRNSGKWSADYDFLGTDIRLYNALRPIDGFGKAYSKPQRTNESVGTQRVLGQVSINIDSELEISYWKVSASTDKPDKRK